MSDFLSRLAERQLTDEPGIAPKLPSRFGPEPQEAEPVERPIENRAPAVAGSALLPQGGPVTEPVDLRPYCVHADKLESTRDPVVHEHAGEPARIPATPQSSDAAQSPDATPNARKDGAPRPQPQAKADVPAVRRNERVEIVERTSETVARELTRLRDVSDASVPLVPKRAEARGLVLQPPPLPPTSRTEAPVVTVTIGRVEVRAVVPPPEPKRPKADVHKALALEDYLERRHGRRR